MGWFRKLHFGSGTLAPALRERLEAEGLVFLGEGLSGTVSYRHFKAPGKRFHGKITPMDMALAVTERRLAAYGGPGRGTLIDSTWDLPHLSALDVTLEREDKVAFRVDYSRMNQPRVSGEITIRITTPDAARIIEHVTARMPKVAAD